MLKQAILDIPTVGAFNLHGSLLPAYRGRAPINWCLVNGEAETGITLHQMTAKPDAGAIVAQQAVAIADDDTALTLHGKVRLAARALLEQELPKLRAGDIRLTPQDESKASYYGRRTPMANCTGTARPANCTTWCAPSPSPTGRLQLRRRSQADGVEEPLAGPAERQAAGHHPEPGAAAHRLR